MTSPRQLTLSDLEVAIDREIQNAIQSRHIGRLADLQAIAGYLMRPAEAAGDKEAARRLRILAARAANAREDLERKLER